MSVIFRGRLERWKEDKGFGFIRPEHSHVDVFIHISALSNSPRRPVVGDIIYYQLHVDNDGKIKAVNARIEGVTVLKPQKMNSHPQKSNQNRLLFKLIALLLFGSLLYVAITQYHPNQSNGSPQQAISSSHDFIFQDAFEHQKSAIQVEGEGTISKLLPDDMSGARHQKMIVVLNSGQTILIAHNIDLAEKIDSIRLGDLIAFNGEYEWNEKGGLVHWTHLDPKGNHIAGWLNYNGKIYQ